MPLRASAALWLPTGYEPYFVPEPEACPPGSLAEAMVQKAPARLDIHDFASRFPGSEEAVLAYHREWQQYVSHTVLPLLQGQDPLPGWPAELARQLDPSEAEEVYLASVAHLHHALEQSPPEPTRQRLEGLLVVHEVQRLRMRAILSLANAASGTDAREALANARRLARFRELAPPSLQAWLNAQTAAEREDGDLAGTDWCALFGEAKPIHSLAGEQAVLVADPTDRGMAEKWQKSWPRNGPDEHPITWENPVRAAAGAKVLWMRTGLSLPVDQGAAFFLNLRGVRGSVSVFVDGVFVGSHVERDDGRVSCRFSLDTLPRGAAPRSLVLRFERPPEAVSVPTLWHAPWLSARFAD
jgi:hypothetical protein